MMDQALLLFTVFLPGLTSLLIVIAARHPNLREGVSLASGAILFLCVVLLYAQVRDNGNPQLQLWEMLPGLTLAFAVEPLGLIFALLASSLWFVTILYAIGYMRAHEEKNQTRFYSLFALAISASLGIAFAENLFTLFIFYEVLTLCTYPLVTHAGTEKARRGGRVYLGILLSTSIVFLLTAIIATWFTAGSISFTPGGVFNTDVSSGTLSVLLLLFVFGIGKAALMPFHRWLPAAMVAPTPVSALLHAVAVVKAGVFTLLKVCVFIFGIETLQTLVATEFLLYLAAFSAFFASLIALRQQNLKARLAYSTVSQLAYISVGALLASKLSAVGSAMHIVMHAFGKITLFFCAGAIYVAQHKTEVRQLVGIGRSMPVTMTAFFIGSVCIIGLPPTGGTWSKWYLLSGAFAVGDWIVAVVLLLGSLLSMGYLLPIAVRAFFAPQAPVEIQEAPRAALLAMSITALGCLLLFLFPDFFYQLAQDGIEGK